MKESKKHLVQWITLFLSLSVVVAFMIVLFSAVVTPYRKSVYKYEEYQEDNLVKVEFQVFSKDKAETRLYVDGQLVFSEKFSFKLENGKVFTMEDDETEYEEVGTIDAYKFVASDQSVTLTCPSTHTYKILCIVFISTFGAIMLGSVAWIIFDKCGSKVVLTEAVEVKKRKKNK